MAADPDSGISIRGISKSFDGTRVLRDIDLEVGRGEFFSLLGPSGCGKSTLLNILGGLETPDSGSIRIGDRDVTHLPAEKRPTNMVFQSYAMFPHLSVAKNVAYGLRRKRLGRRERDEKVERMLSLVHLDGLGDRNPSELSGGQRQRVALARALVMEPAVLLLDESLAALDRRLREAMQIELRELQREVGITFVFVTHDQDEAMSMSDRIAVMGGGRILQIGRPTELYHAPASREVAEFIGSINLIEVTPCAGGRLEAPGLGAFDCDSAAGEGGLLALRPECFGIAREAPAAGNRLEGRVREVTFLGDRSYLRVNVEGLEDPLIASCSFREAEGLSRDDRVWLTWSAEDGRLIPSDR
ncbi:ATP-binding cassette domain-containing protein [Aquicoccus sp. SCR17]|nr:ATP-binding cassette domain-containing protein [Carideicomes alvinocaridis]